MVRLNRHRRFTFPVVNDILFPGRQLALNYQLMAAIIYIVMATSRAESIIRKQFVFFYKLGRVMIVLIKNALTCILICLHSFFVDAGGMMGDKTWFRCDLSD